MFEVFRVIEPFAVALPSLFLFGFYHLWERSFSLLLGFMVRVKHPVIGLGVLNHQFDDDRRIGADIHCDLLPIGLVSLASALGTSVRCAGSESHTPYQSLFV